MTTLLKRNRDVESLEIAASWPGADWGSVVTLATRLAAVDENAEGVPLVLRDGRQPPDTLTRSNASGLIFNPLRRSRLMLDVPVRNLIARLMTLREDVAGGMGRARAVG